MADKTVKDTTETERPADDDVQPETRKTRGLPMINHNVSRATS